eukprot:4421039-Pyramimonas_sp.AAC.1
MAGAPVPRAGLRGEGDWVHLAEPWEERSVSPPQLRPVGARRGDKWRRLQLRQLRVRPEQRGLRAGGEHRNIRRPPRALPLEI